MKLLLGLVGVVAGYSSCFPATCKSYSDCKDPYHSNSFAWCCNNRCVEYQNIPDPAFVGQSCSTALSLFGSSSCKFCDPYAATCGTNGVCKSKLPNGCACTLSTELDCISSNCGTSTTGASVCIGSASSTPLGATCYANSECVSSTCLNNKCAGLAQGAQCSYYNDYCGPGLQCFYNTSSVYTYSCQPLCAQGSSGCCSNGNKCVAGTYCQTYNYTCSPILPAGADCTSYYASGGCGAGLTCDCGSTDCTSHKCVAEYSVADGNRCYYGSTACKQNSWCAPINSSFIYVCIGNASIANGAACSTSLPGGANEGAQCVAPANACADVNNNGQAICHVGGSVPVGGGCDYSFAKGDCASGGQCALNYSVGYYQCSALLTAGQNCTDSTSSLKCIAGTQCYNTGTPTTSCYSLSVGCTCNTILADGANCINDVQCKATSRCVIATGKCTQVEGLTCTSQTDCGDLYSDWDCNCSGKCHLEVAPPTPVVYTDPCASQLAAARAVYPNVYGSQTGYGYVSGSTWGSTVGPFLGTLNDTNVVSKILAWICCETCVTGRDRFAAPPGGWQGDCATFTLKQLPYTCTPTSGNIALQNCFKSSASQVAFSLTAVVAAFALL